MKESHTYETSEVNHVSTGEMYKLLVTKSCKEGRDDGLTCAKSHGSIQYISLPKY